MSSRVISHSVKLGATAFARRQWLARSAGKVPHDIELQQLGLVRRKLEDYIAADTGVDAVDSLTGGEQLLQLRASPADPRPGGFGKLDRRLPGRCCVHLLDREWLLAYADGGSCHEQL